MSSLQFIPALPLLATALLFTSLATATGVISARRCGNPWRGVVATSRVLLIGAVLAVLTVTVLGGHGGPGVNAIPLRGIAGQLSNVNRQLGLLNLAGNVAMFMPVGLLVPVATGWRWGRTVVASALLSLGIELAQVFIGRSGDVDDILLNTTGAGLAALVAVVVARPVRSRAMAEVPGIHERCADPR